MRADADPRRRKRPPDRIPSGAGGSQRSGDGPGTGCRHPGGDRSQRGAGRPPGQPALGLHRHRDRPHRDRRHDDRSDAPSCRLPPRAGRRTDPGNGGDEHPVSTVYYDGDADLGALDGKRVAVIGYGSQGHAHALNLQDNGIDVVVGLYEGSPSWARAEEHDLRVETVEKAVEISNLVMMLVPDQTQKQLYELAVKPHLKPGSALMFAHGFNIHFNQIVPPDDVDVAMVAPKGPGHIVRRLFTEGIGVPALFAVYQDRSGQARGRTLAYAKGIGSTRAGVLETSFKEETETDLFGEQAVLCGGVTALIKNGFETLVEAGYQPEVAYFECMHELKLIVDLLYQGGMSYMRYSVS